jgi:outer membrane autotransporter protein
MAGPYATIRFSENVFLQGRAAWGTSDNSVSPFLTYTDKFETERWLVSSTLVGRWEFGSWEFRPSVSVSYIEDQSDAYVDSLGVAIPGIDVSLGQFKAGPEFSYKIELADGTTLEPRASAEVIWNFDSSDDVASFGGTLAGGEDVRGRVTLGLRAGTMSGVGVDFSGSYDGIGSDSFEAVTDKATLRVPLN